jgi:tetratricopeptide (TPR) repeat protein
MSKRREKKRKQSKAMGAGIESFAQTSQEIKSFPPGSFKSRHLLWIFPALIVINLFIYAQAGRYQFTHWDDPAYVSKNAEVSRGLTWEGVRWAFTASQEANWHPLTWLSHMLDVQLFGMASGPHHLVGVFFHIANTLLLFWILFRMTAAIGQSAFVAGLFAAHPLHVESVAWIAERKDVLSAFFFFLTIWAYIAYVRKPASRRYVLIALLFALALMAKPMAVTLPLILLLLDIWPLGRCHVGPGQWPVCLRLIREKAPLIVLSIASSAVTLWAQLQGGAVVKVDAYSLSSRAANALASYLAYLGHMFWPAGLSAFYPYSSVHALWALGCFLALACVTIVAIRFARHPYFLVGWLWYLGMLLPVIGLIQVGAQARADRYTYLPLIGIFVVIAWGIPKILNRLQRSEIPLAIIAGLLVCASAAVARNQVRCWENGVVLWEHALKAFPNSHFVHLNAGYELNERGEVAKAVQHYTEALRINPNFAEAHNALGVALIKQGRKDEAFDHFSQAVRIKPNYAEARNNLGVKMAELGKTDEAISNLTAASTMNPQDAQVQFDLGLALVKQGKSDEAIPYLSKALQLDPNFVVARDWMGNALSLQGKLDEAIAQYKEALRIKPDFAEARNDYGIALVNQGKLNEAIVQYREALRVKPDLVEAYNGLGNVLSMQNKPDEAIVQYKEALRMAPNWAEAHLNWGVVLAGQGKLEEAKAHYLEAIRIKPNLAEAHNKLGDALLMQRQSGAAIVQYKEALRLSPNDINAQYNLGIAWMTQSSYDEAIRNFSEVLRVMPNNIGAHGYLGLALLNKGREQEAIPHLKEVLRAKPDDKISRDALQAAQTRLAAKSKLR